MSGSMEAREVQTVDCTEKVEAVRQPPKLHEETGQGTVLCLPYTTAEPAGAVARDDQNAAMDARSSDELNAI